MNRRKVGAIVFGIIIICLISFIIYKVIIGEAIGVNEVMVTTLVMITFLSANTWGTKEEKDGILQDEELGKRITEKSAKYSYYILIVFILLAVAADWFVNGSNNIFLLLILGFGMITLPFVQYVVARKFQ